MRYYSFFYYHLSIQLLTHNYFMKLLFTLFFIAYCSVAGLCQSGFTPTTEPSMEDLRREVLNMKEDGRQMQLNLHRAHREFRTGTIFYTVGLGLALLAGSNENTSPGLVLLGSGFLITGGILHIDSHKHIGRAGVIDSRRR